MDNDTKDNISVLQAETLALRMAIRKAKELNLSVVEIEGDNLCLINILNGIWCCPWDINILVCDLFSDLSQGFFFKCSHVFREINHVADRVAKLGFRHFVDCAWKNDSELMALVRKDAIGQRFSRV